MLGMLFVSTTVLSVGCNHADDDDSAGDDDDSAASVRVFGLRNAGPSGPAFLILQVRRTQRRRERLRRTAGPL